MEHLPPVGWADVATKHDLDHLRAETKVDLDHLEVRLDARFERIDGRFEQLADQLRAEFRLESRNIVFAMVASNATFAALAVAAARLG